MTARGTYGTGHGFSLRCCSARRPSWPVTLTDLITEIKTIEQEFAMLILVYINMCIYVFVERISYPLEVCTGDICALLLLLLQHWLCIVKNTPRLYQANIAQRAVIDRLTLRYETLESWGTSNKCTCCTRGRQSEVSDSLQSRFCIVGGLTS